MSLTAAAVTTRLLDLLYPQINGGRLNLVLSHAASHICLYMLGMVLNLSTGLTLGKAVKRVIYCFCVYERDKLKKGTHHFFSIACVCPNSIAAPPEPLLINCSLSV